MLGTNLSDQIPGGPNLTLTLTLNSNYAKLQRQASFLAEAP